METLEFLYTIGGNVNCTCSEKQYGGSSKIKNLLYNPAIPLLFIYPKELKIGSCTDTYTPMLALFITVQIEK